MAFQALTAYVMMKETCGKAHLVFYFLTLCYGLDVSLVAVYRDPCKHSSDSNFNDALWIAEETIITLPRVTSISVYYHQAMMQQLKGHLFRRAFPATFGEAASTLCCKI